MDVLSVHADEAPNRRTTLVTKNMNLRTWIIKSIDRIPTSQTLTLSAISVCVGLTTGLGVWLFKRAIDLVQPGMDGAPGYIQPALGKWTIALVPAVGGVIVGLILY